MPKIFQTIVRRVSGGGGAGAPTVVYLDDVGAKDAVSSFAWTMSDQVGEKDLHQAGWTLGDTVGEKDAMSAAWTLGDTEGWRDSDMILNMGLGDAEGAKDAISSFGMTLTDQEGMKDNAAITGTGTPQWITVATAGLTTSGNLITCSMPSGIQVGDLLLAFVAATDTGSTIGLALQTPSGWTAVANTKVAGTADVTMGGCVYRIADGTEGSTQTFSTTGTVNVRRMTAEIHLVRAVSATPINAFTQTTLAGTALVPDPVGPAVTTTVANCLVFTHLAHDHLALTQTHLPPSGWTERTDFESTVTANIVGTHNMMKVQGTAGSTGTATHDCSETVSTDGVMTTVAIAPGSISINL